MAQSGVELLKDKRRPYQAAYRLWQLRLYPGWDENSWDGGVGDHKGPLHDDHIVYLQDNYMVCRGTYYNKNVIWPEWKVTPEWKEFCTSELKFQIPEWTQRERNWTVLSKKEKEEARAERDRLQKEKLDTAPTPFHGWDVVPDVLPDFKIGEVELKVTYRSGPLKKMGDSKEPQDVQDTPDVTYNADPMAFYSLLMIDPDAPARWNPELRAWKHWMVINIPSTHISGGTVVTEYKGPAPPTGSGWHRYIFLLYKHAQKLPLEKEDMSNKRYSFDVNKWAEERGLGLPIAGHLFQIHAPRFM